MKTREELIQDFWPDWIIEEEIGGGSYGTVYRAKKENLAGTSFAAVKIILVPGENNDPELSSDLSGASPEQSETYLAEIVRNLAHEISLMETVKGHTNIVGMEDYRIERLPGQLQWVILIRMELLTPLTDYTALHPPGEQDCIRLGTDLCTALSVCRRHRIIHRDIKPENICVNATGDYKLGDFGEARILDPLTLHLTRKGTPNYMAPELYDRRAALDSIEDGSRIDIYSLGLVMYWLSNHRRLPFQPDRMLTPRDRLEAFQRRIGGEELPPPSGVSPGLARIILKACAYRPEDRYASPDEMKQDLERLRDGRPEGEPDPPPPGKGTPRRLWLPVLAAVLALALLAFGLFRLLNASPSPAPEQRETETPDGLPLPTDRDEIYYEFIQHMTGEQSGKE